MTASTHKQLPFQKAGRFPNLPVQRDLAISLLLLIILWGTRLYSLEALPLHNDEGLHLQRAVEVWHGHPFWAITDGKIINHWLIAAFYPQNAAAFVSRYATLLVSMLGLAAGYALMSRLFGTVSAVLGAVFWIATPYLFFFERTALSDAEAGALVVVTLWAAYRLAESGRARDAALTGFTIGIATQFKFTAAPYALSVLLIIMLWGRQSFKRRIINLVIVGVAGALTVSVPLAYIVLTAGDFSVAFGWVGGGTGGGLFPGLEQTLQRLTEQVWGPTAVTPTVWIVLGWLGLPLTALVSQRMRWSGAFWLVIGLLPITVITLIATTIEPRHFVVSLPILLLLAGAGWGGAIGLLPTLGDTAVRAHHAGPLQKYRYTRRSLWFKSILAGLLSVILLLGFIPFARTAYHFPGDLPLPSQMARQYIWDHSSGFGLREAVQDFPNTLGEPQTNLPKPNLYAAMFADSCRRANFYDRVGYSMFCPEFPGLYAVEESLAAQDGPVYVLHDGVMAGLDFASLDVDATLLASYPRPANPPFENASPSIIHLWRLDKRE